MLGCPLSLLSFNISGWPKNICLHFFLTNPIDLEVLTTVIRQEKETESIQSRKKEAKLSLFADDMTLLIENPRDSTKKEEKGWSINKFSKFPGYIISIHMK